MTSPTEVYTRLARMRAEEAAQASAAAEAIEAITSQPAGSRYERKQRELQVAQLMSTLETAAHRAEKLNALIALPTSVITEAVPALDLMEYGRGDATTPMSRRLSAETNSNDSPYSPDYIPNRKVEDQIRQVQAVVDEWSDTSDRASMGLPAPAPVSETPASSGNRYEDAGAAWLASTEDEG